MQVEKRCTAVVLRELVLISGQPGTPRWTPVKGRTVFPMPVEMACPRQESPQRQVWKTWGKEAQGCWWIRSSALLIGRTRGARIRDQSCTRCRNHLDRCRSITIRLCLKRGQCAGLSMTITVWQATEAGGRLEPSTRPLLEPAQDELVLEVLHCGLCHSDLSMLDNDWGMSAYPLVPGHEVVGRVVQVGAGVDPGVIGELRGLGWISGRCSHCGQCLGGTGNLCSSLEATILGRQGGFASHVTARQDWAIPLPQGMDPAVAGPLFCGGITVFAPLIDEAVSPTARVAVIGIGGLGHLALQFARAWGCEVTALTTNLAKTEDARGFGAHHVHALGALSDLAGRFDLVINTVNHALPWADVMGSLAPRGRLHQLGAVLEPIQVGAFDLIAARRSITGSPTSSPASLLKMVDFCVRHQIQPAVEHLPMDQVNEAIARLRRGDVRYRFVLDQA